MEKKDYKIKDVAERLEYNLSWSFDFITVAIFTIVLFSALVGFIRHVLGFCGC